ncbi:efflux RND transporter periplasmic adaptor subunit [Prodigiosinella confusarubida]|uniref:Efflux RND transporter periplasmic adaptor subunit n=1 Tax=Serratia sp. (strain ATCC 39006) TaxID=104623 RepID=A0A2I5TA91_SERS3|nr:efflux RND transporter periplasmic adaptor subunit [Serratia sp. ATCC 39006]AUH01442.1 efflux RND transporter periplasmic adaptor subunit [Serratia sp. ATCC 39006]AUH05764.1 efflux RND transporter periplasmic adaptor subunit [Serratia sp. ATCC 39006]
MQRVSIIVFSLVCVALTGCDGQKQASAPPPQPVKAMQVQLVPYQKVTHISGEVAAKVQADLAFRTEGRVIARLVDVGSRVHKGEVLARLDDVEKRADVDVAQATLRAARATLKLKQSIFSRDQKLLATRAISQAEWDQAREDFSSAQAGLASARSSLNTANDALTYTELRADADGVIVSRQLEVGQVVASAQTVFTLAHDGLRDAVFQVPEALLVNEQPGDNIDVSLLSIASSPLTARVREVAPLLDETRGTVRVKATLPATAQWPLGAPVVGSFVTKESQGILLPPGALTSMRGKPAVWVIDKEKHVVSLQAITVSRYRAHDVVVTAGLTPGAWVVTEGGKFLIAGQRVSQEQK